MSAPRPCARALLLGAALLAACNPVDPIEALAPLSNACVPLGQCADGFVCVGTTCYLRAGEACDAAFEWEPCRLTLGVCAAARRTCEGGRVAATCPDSAYGPDYQVQEVACDGLDNDCDGVPDQARPVNVTGLVPPDVNLRGSSRRVLPFGEGFLAVTVSRANISNRPSSNSTSAVRVRALDGQLRPSQDSAELLLAEGAYPIPRLQVVPFQGGAFVLWVGDQGLLHLARIDRGAGGEPVPGLAARVSPVQAPDLRLAVSADAQRVLLAWSDTQLQGQLFSPALEPLPGPQPLSAPVGDEGATQVGLFDVDADGEGFVAAWSVAFTASPAPPLTHSVRVARFSSSLERVGAVVPLPEGSATFTELRVQGARSAEEQPTVAWVRQLTNTINRGMRHARPFAAGSPSSELRVTGENGGLEFGRGEAGTALLFFPRLTGSAYSQERGLFLRRIAPDNSATERNFGVPSSPDPGGTAFPELHGMPWTIAFTSDGGSLQYVSTCSL